MSKYQQFIFEGYLFDAATKVLTLHYAYDSALHFAETYYFDFDFAPFAPETLDRALQSLFFIAGVSYYKAFLAPEIIVNKGQIDKPTAEFLGKTYQKGLGEFFYVNQLDPRTPVVFPVNAEAIAPLQPSTSPEGALIAIGGGKDSLVTVELLRDHLEGLATWSLNHRPQLTPLVERIGLPHYWVEREWDPQLFQLKDDPEAYNGHIPISAIFACVGTIVAILSGRKDVVVSNEQSASEPMLHYQGVAINHQYSKSIEFEQDYQAYLAHTLGDTTGYFSFLRPLSEVRIAELFAKVGFDKYQDVFSSCNKAFVHGNDRMFWDGTCPKCAFVFLTFTPFVSRDQLEALFSGKNLLLDPTLEATYRQLLGIEGDRPLECVGDIKESRTAMRLAQKQYPELSTYQFDLPGDYDYRTVGPHRMPTEFFDLLLGVVTS
jgi:hypothetical protein